MLAKYWKKIGLIILIVACLINVMSKLVNKVSLNKELTATVEYLYNQYQQENKK
ncbi:MAG: hypothetical protein IKF83_00190 [Clostridia bacterium]|nr:hypothetical protein [Clostridia bacterium]